MTAEPILEINELTVEFKSRGAKSHRALDRVSLSLFGGGAALAIVGESGSGKSTLLRSAIGLIPPKSGSVKLFGKELNAAARRELTALRRRCGYVPQDPYGALPPGLSVIDAVMEPEIIAGVKRPKAKRRERGKELLAEFGLTDERIFASRAVGLSGGQRQRVELARALMLGPELLLCDEPTSMQDASTRGEIIEALRRRTEKGNVDALRHPRPAPRRLRRGKDNRPQRRKNLRKRPLARNNAGSAAPVHKGADRRSAETT